jgi:hypothetical protein
MNDQNVLMKLHKRSAGAAPARIPGSVRRTSSIDTSWPDGPNGNTRLIGRARDIVTPRAGGKPIVCAEDSFDARLRQDRTIASIATDPARVDLSRLIGRGGGGGYRRALDEIVPEERRNGTPLYLLLDDLAGASLVSRWAFSQWDPGWTERIKKDPNYTAMAEGQIGICIGKAPDSSAFDPAVDQTSGAPAVELRNPDDPEGWHEMTVQNSSAMAARRARRIDVRRENGVLLIEAAFQDSAPLPAGGRRTVHEYTLTATADVASLRLLSVSPQPRVLPFVECPSAITNLTQLIGVPLTEMRERVPAALKGVAGCTHLNDAMRALAEMPTLVGYMDEHAI